MNGAMAALTVNIAVAGLFAASFAIIALSYRSQRAALWFSAAYVIGMFTPGSEFLIPLAQSPEPLVAISYASFLCCILAMSFAFAVFHGRQPPWIAIIAIFVAGLALRTFIWNGQRDTLPYEIAYQLPFAAAAILGCVTVLRLGNRTLLYVALAVMFGVIALHFTIKPFLAVTLGSGSTASAYTASKYALVSQASTGILLVATGLLVLLLVVQKAVSESQLASETDPLSGILNRRGFGRLAEEALRRGADDAPPLSVALFDLDHFKAVNDEFGHAAGDAVIVAFSELLRRGAPQSAFVGRIGGEEFAVLIEGAVAESARLNAEAIRVAVRGAPVGGVSVTVSGGVAQRRTGDTLADLMRRADRALYRAKAEGRDRVCVAEGDRPATRSANVVPLNGR